MLMARSEYHRVFLLSPAKTPGGASRCCWSHGAARRPALHRLEPQRDTPAENVLLALLPWMKAHPLDVAEDALDARTAEERGAAADLHGALDGAESAPRHDRLVHKDLVRALEARLVIVVAAERDHLPQSDLRAGEVRIHLAHKALNDRIVPPFRRLDQREWPRCFGHAHIDGHHQRPDDGRMHVEELVPLPLGAAHADGVVRDEDPFDGDVVRARRAHAHRAPVIVDMDD